jgi:hypothetical protein
MPIESLLLIMEYQPIYGKEQRSHNNSRGDVQKIFVKLISLPEVNESV